MPMAGIGTIGSAIDQRNRLVPNVRPGDFVCVTPGVRAQAASGNAAADSRRLPTIQGGGLYPQVYPRPDWC